MKTRETRKEEKQEVTPFGVLHVHRDRVVASFQYLNTKRQVKKLRWFVKNDTTVRRGSSIPIISMIILNHTHDTSGKKGIISKFELSAEVNWM